MPIITKIEPQRRKGRFNIHLDNKFAAGVSEEVIVILGLKEGEEIDCQKIKEFEKQEEEAKAYNAALRFLSFRPRSEKEVKDKLSQKFSQNLVEKTISRLKKDKFLDEEEFTKAWIRNRMILKPKGKRFILQELIQKGVPKDLIKKILEKEYNQDKELLLAHEVAKSKLKYLKDLSQREKYQKMVGFLARRGFDWGVIKKVLEGL